MNVFLALVSILRWTLCLMTLPLLVELFVLTVGALLPARSRDANSNSEANNTSDASTTLPLPVQNLIVIVPSHNEELNITRCVESLALAFGSPSNVLVIAHNCTDNTAALAARAGARVEVVNDPALAGKGHALKHGFETAFHRLAAEAVMIVDADSTVSPNITRVVSRRLALSPVVQCRYQVKNYAASWRTSLMSLAFLGINVVRARGRDRLGLSCGIFGNGFAMRKEVLEHVDYDAHSIVEDMEFHLALVEHGYRVRFVNEAYVLGDMPLSAATSASQHSRWEGGRIRLLSDWGPSLFRRIMQGKLALTEPLIDLLGLPLALEVFTLLVLLVFPSTGTRLYVLAAFGVISLHLAAIVRCSPDPSASLQTLLHAPVYLVGRLTMLSSAVKASRKGAVWVRTTRDSTEPAATELMAAKAAPGSQEIS